MYNSNMKKVIFGIFAHPDDESFGPCGTFLTATRAGADLHLITLTLGEAGMNPNSVTDLAKVREREWHKAGRLMGAKSMHFLGYADSKLDNTDLVEAGHQLQNIITTILDGYHDPVEVSFVTSDLNGISGHIDHIVAARAASWVYYRRKATDNRFKEISYAVIPSTYFATINTDWLFMEPGRRPDEINRTIDARRYRDEIIAIMRCHRTQKHDYETHILRRGDTLGLEYFIVRN